jgi:hypothetical protein
MEVFEKNIQNEPLISIVTSGIMADVIHTVDSNQATQFIIGKLCQTSTLTQLQILLDVNKSK